MQIVRTLNNNAVLVTRGSGEKAVVFGRGVGYKKSLGDTVDESAVTHTFVPDGQHSLSRLVGYLRDLPLEVVGLAHKAVSIAEHRLGLQPSQALLLTIADHLNVALIRYAKAESETGVELDLDSVTYPLAWEVSQLYPRELEAGREVVAHVSRERGTPLPEGEAVAFAMHFVNAQFADDDFSHTVAMTGRIQQILALVEASLGIRIDHDSMNVARFVTHLRYLFVRLATQAQFDDGLILQSDDMRKRNPRAFGVAARIQSLLEMDGRHINDDEVTYLSIHIARLDRASRGV